MDKTSLVAVDKKCGPVVNLENVERIEPYFDPGKLLKSVTLFFVSGKSVVYERRDAHRIINALNARFELELGA